MAPLRRCRSGLWRGAASALFLACLLPARPGWADEGEALARAGAALAARGAYDQAIEAYRRAFALRPRDPVVRRNLALAYGNRGSQLLAAGQFREAEDLFQTAAELDPAEASLQLGLGYAQLRQRDLRAATASFQRAVSAGPRNAEAYRYLGEAYYQQGDLAAALGEWERALELNPADAVLRARLERARQEARVEGGYRSRESHHFQLRYEGQRREDVGREVLGILERAYIDVGYDLGHYPAYPIQVMLYSEEDFRRVTDLPHWVGGAFNKFDGKIRVPIGGLGAPSDRLARTLFHEYAHAALYGITRGNLPQWLNEGLAVRAEKGAADLRPRAAAAARGGHLIPLRSLEGSFMSLQGPATVGLAYAEGASAAAYLIEQYGMSGVQALLQRLGHGGTFDAAFQETFGATPEEFEARWRASLVEGY